MHKRLWFSTGLLISLLLAILGGLSPAPAFAQNDPALILTLAAHGPLTPAMGEYLARGIRTAEERQAQLLIFQLDTPGGEYELMNRMVQEIRGSQVPVIVYIAPRGAVAGSAGAVITLAGHLAAMAPETAIGAASPVGGQGEDLGETMEAKLKNILQATVRSLAERRGPKAVELAEQTIATARAVSAREAQQAGLVDFIAGDQDDLLRQLDGQRVEMAGGEQRILVTANARVEPLPLSFIEQLLQTLTNPNFIFLLLTIGVQAVLIELSSPGGWVAGFIGVVSLALATYGLGVLPVNWFGLIFLATAFVLFLLDIKAPTHGALTAAGVASLITGALVLFNSPRTPASYPLVSVPLVVATSLVTAVVFAVIVSYAVRAQRAPIRTGQESFVGKVGIARTDLSPQGTVQLAGELWTAVLLDRESGQGDGGFLAKGMRVQVIKVEGVRLYVRKAAG